jgi:hypothetical protein
MKARFPIAENEIYYDTMVREGKEKNGRVLEGGQEFVSVRICGVVHEIDYFRSPCYQQKRRSS